MDKNAVKKFAVNARRKLIDSVSQKAYGLGISIDAIKEVEKIPNGSSEALKIAKEADVIVCAMGESAEMSGECGSRTNLEMPDVQRELLAELLKTGKPVVLNS